MTDAKPVLYIIMYAAPPARRIDTLINRAQARGWESCLGLTPSAARWLTDDLPKLENLTGHTIRSTYKLPTEPDVLPPPTRCWSAQPRSTR